MAAFETVGTALENGLSGYAESISASLISNIAPVIVTGVTLYFLLKGWMFLTGRAEGAIADTVISAFKIAIISMVGLNTGNFVSMGIGFINGAESMLMSSLPSGATSGWAAIDDLWGQMQNALESFFRVFSSIDSFWDGIAFSLLFALLLLLFFVAGAFLTLASLGVLIIAKLALVVVMGFGPLFICMLMFPVTRSWFDGWFKACMTFVFTIVIMSALLSLVQQIFSDRIDQLNSVLSQNFDSGAAADFCVSVFTFIIVCIALATLTKAVPSMASAITGGMGLGAVGLGAMLHGIGIGTANVAKTGALGVATYGVASGNQGLTQSAMNFTRLTPGGVGAYLGGWSARASADTAVSASVRAHRALNAAMTSSGK